jgi:hypothetical protein
MAKKDNRDAWDRCDLYGLIMPRGDDVANEHYRAIIESAVETRNIDFKAAMDWRLVTKCERFEVLLDVAAMANAGGGYLVIGRDEPTRTTGTLTQEQVVSFDPTEVNKVVHRYLDPAHECRVDPQDVDGDLLVVIDVPAFEDSPLIFKEVGNCGGAGCKKAPHFLPGDVFVRTKAQQTRRVGSADEMREIVNRAVRSRGDDLLTAMQRMLGAPQPVEAPPAVSPYDAEYRTEHEEFFKPLFDPWIGAFGHYDLTVRPIEYRADRLELKSVPRKIREFAYVLYRNGIVDGVPYEGNHKGENTVNGARLRMQEPLFRRVEGVSLCTSGLYRIVRQFQEDFKLSEDRTQVTLMQHDRELYVDLFVEQMTMLYLLARNVALQVTDDEDEDVQIDVRVDGLEGRLMDANMLDPLEHFRIGLRQQPGSKNAFYFPLRTTSRALKVDAVSIAREQCAKIMWTFGMTEQCVLAFQRRLLGNAEPLALPQGVT